MKRPLSCDNHNNDKAKHPKEGVETSLPPTPTIGCDYLGYSFQKDPVVVETLDATSMDSFEFFQRFISKRKPCILQTNNTTTTTTTTATTTTPLPSISLQDLVAVAGQEVVQVERRFSPKESFGQNRTKTRQILMTIQDLVNKLKTTEGELLYLSTQQLEDKATNSRNKDNQNDEDEDSTNDNASSNPFQTPCAQLLKANKISPTLSWASTLRLESCNLWMGRTSQGVGSSSGLHHDYHDNFYLLLQGRKQFRLFSPDTAHFMSTYGTIERIHFNGVISYLGSETYADSAPIMVKKDHDSEDDDDEDNDESEEEVVLGKGFDYESDNDDDDSAEDEVDLDGPDDFDAMEAASSPPAAEQETKDPQEDDTSRPNSFSRIDPVNVDQEKFPHFGTCNEYIVELKAGQILYLPAGWFHCVTSYSSQTEHDDRPGNDDDQVHMALNYWYHPPDQLESFANPYRRGQLKSG